MPKDDTDKQAETTTEATSEESTTDTTPHTPEGDDGAAGSEVDWKAEAAKWKAYSRKNEDRAKENAEKARAWDEWQESQKSEDDKRADELDTLTRERDDNALRAHLAEAALEHGLTKEQLAILGTGDLDSLSERAAALAQLLGTAPRARRDPNVGREETITPDRPDGFMRALL
ncbi:hypothetical protein H8R18_01280 [Nanchangia anserum]|uniref:Scaffolding protein n=1 Tax=Nanchangia anserum TaxID=2692125 RepID=A0A8I0GH22_9ACTO|nr:hypothetical protein [Nanchangia anserum]MBD3689869.1 hypothetical protein [Nanchangia anserum]QOX82037.1 hypothetical protein H8R18_01280 [Nanchangia anserum]